MEVCPASTKPPPSLCAVPMGLCLRSLAFHFAPPLPDQTPFDSPGLAESDIFEFV